VSLYIETFIRAPLDRVWTHTQDPALHQQWDLRFSEILYVPRTSDDAPQRFHYATRIGFGLSIRGEGESTGTRHRADGSATSALRFWSAHPLSLITEGSGYWKYVPESDGVRFFTSYDYRTRFGALGRAVDRLAFRPLMGWATAWSFDRLRRWLEDGTPPAWAFRAAAARAVARGGLALVFAYHGLVPKLLRRDADEVAMLRDAGLAAYQIDVAMRVLGVAECAFAVVLLTQWRARWPVIATIVAMLVATLSVAIASPRYLGAAFNPVTLNLLVLVLAVIDLLMHGIVPSATACRRRPSASVS
jgi:hypothetical protein